MFLVLVVGLLVLGLVRGLGLVLGRRLCLARCLALSFVFCRIFGLVYKAIRAVQAQNMFLICYL